MAIFNKNCLFWGEFSGGEVWDFLGVSVVAFDGGVVLYLKPLDDRMEELGLCAIYGRLGSKYLGWWKLRVAVRVVNQTLNALKVAQHLIKPSSAELRVAFFRLERNIHRFEGCQNHNPSICRTYCPAL